MGLKLWEDTLDEHGSHPQVKRMVRDHLEFYDVLVNCMDHGFTFRIKWASGPNLDAPQLSKCLSCQRGFSTNGTWTNFCLF